MVCACTATSLSRCSLPTGLTVHTVADFAMDSAPSEGIEARPGPSGLSIHATVAVTVHCTGNGHSSNGSLSDTPKRPRKRSRRPKTWQRAAAKAKRARGEEYVSPSTGKTVAARSTGPPCSCKQKCFDRFTDREKASVVRSFYALENKELQDAHLFGLIHASSVQRGRPRTGGVKTVRQATHTYMVSMDIGYRLLL